MEAVMAHPKQKSLKDYPELTAPDDAVTVVNEGEVVAVGGVVAHPIRDGVGEAWCIVANLADKDTMFGVEAFNAMRGKLEAIIADRDYDVVEAHVRDDFPDAIRFVALLGFAQKCVKIQAAPDGCDMFLFEKGYNERV